MKKINDLFSKKIEIVVARSMSERAILNYGDMKKDVERDRELFITKMELLRKSDLFATEQIADDYVKKIKYYEELISSHGEKLYKKMQEEEAVTTQITNLQEHMQKQRSRILNYCSSIESQIEMLNNNLGKLIAIPLPASTTERLKELALNPDTYSFPPSTPKPLQHTQKVKITPILNTNSPVASLMLPPPTTDLKEEVD